MAQLKDGMVGTIAYTLHVDGVEFEEVTAEEVDVVACLGPARMTRHPDRVPWAQ